MLTQEQNDRLTQVGPGTPMGELMRRYWHPIAGSSQLDAENPTKAVRLLGEDLVLYRDASGTLGLLEPSCPHRKASLLYGIPEPNGIRCCYHGWIMNETGRCVDQPSEPEGSRFKDKVRIKAYPVQELGGLIFAYMGPEPAPLLPRYDILVWPGTRNATSVALPCNWLQCHENSLDPVHFQWLHRYWGGWVMNRKRPPEERDEFNRATAARGAEHRRIGFELTDYGIIKRRLVGEETEDDEYWRIGHPILFPNILRVVNTLQFRVPVDDTHTIHLVYQHQHAEPGQTAQETVPFEERSVYDDDGRFRADYVLGQDQTAWAIQGPVTDRTTERLGVSDVGIIMYRRLLEEQLQIVEDGGEPMNVHRDPAKNECIVFPVEHYVYPGETETGGPFKDSRPREPDVVAELSGEGARLPAWKA
ncbi:MAG: Rieske 2Fe-2S domain-containing protein [Chloroflexi bacterium]|nr:Rieske 2Fe-2S domain-containing protein [Chloroflexota bacterium]